MPDISPYSRHSLLFGSKNLRQDFVEDFKSRTADDIAAQQGNVEQYDPACLASPVH